MSPPLPPEVPSAGHFEASGCRTFLALILRFVDRNQSAVVRRFLLSLSLLTNELWYPFVNVKHSTHVSPPLGLPYLVSGAINLLLWSQVRHRLQIPHPQDLL